MNSSTSTKKTISNSPKYSSTAITVKPQNFAFDPMSSAMVKTVKKPPPMINKIYSSTTNPGLFAKKTQTLKPLFNYADDEPLATRSSAALQNTNKINSNEVDQAIKLTLRLKKKTIQSSSFSSQTFPMLASLLVDELATTNKAPLDLVCVIDHSGSMSGEKIELVKESFKSLLRFLGDSDRLSIVIFDNNASRLVPLVRTTEKNKKLILSQLKNVQGDGYTDINLGMTHAFEILKQRRYKNPVTSIFLLSDGLDTLGDGAQNRVKSTLSRYNIPDDVTINTFGFGNDHDPQMMNDIADLRDGNFYFVEQLDTVDEAFVDCLGGLLSSIGQNVTITIFPEQSNVLRGVEIVKAYGEASMWAKDGNIYITKMSHVISGRQKDFVLELNIPRNTKELQDHEKLIKVASAEAHFTAIDGKPITKRAELFITLLNESEEAQEEEDDREVMKNFYRVKGASVFSQARKLADIRIYDEAKKLLQNFKEELKGCFLKTEEFIKNLIKDIEKAEEDVDPKIYELSGKHNMMESVRATMSQKPNFKSANFNLYQNSVQMSMVREVQSMKLRTKAT